MGMHLYFECYYKKYCIFTAFALLEHTVGSVLLRPRKSRNKGGWSLKRVSSWVSYRMLLVALNPMDDRFLVSREQTFCAISRGAFLRKFGRGNGDEELWREIQWGFRKPVWV